MTKKIVVTGIGASSPLGGTAPESWAALLAGESGTHKLTHEWVEQYELPVQIAAEAKVRPDDRFMPRWNLVVPAAVADRRWEEPT